MRNGLHRVLSTRLASQVSRWRCALLKEPETPDATFNGIVVELCGHYIIVPHYHSRWIVVVEIRITVRNSKFSPEMYLKWMCSGEARDCPTHGSPSWL